MAYSNTASLYSLTISTLIENSILWFADDIFALKVVYFSVFIILANNSINLLILLLK